MLSGTSEEERAAFEYVLELIPQWPRCESRTLSLIFPILYVF